MPFEQDPGKLRTRSMLTNEDQEILFTSGSSMRCLQKICQRRMNGSGDMAVNSAALRTSRSFGACRVSMRFARSSAVTFINSFRIVTWPLQTDSTDQAGAQFTQEQLRRTQLINAATGNQTTTFAADQIDQG